ncbi:MAG TPA: type II toxin-antitoxin system VapB family antitoxin [Rhodanobacteraceae bacterium]
MHATAKVFKSGNSQAVRLPKAFRFNTKEVEIFRRGDEVVLREAPRSLAEAFAGLAELPDGIWDDIRETRAPEEREQI